MSNSNSYSWVFFKNQESVSTINGSGLLTVFQINEPNENMKISVISEEILRFCREIRLYYFIMRHKYSLDEI